MTLSQGRDTIVRYIIKTQHGSRELCPGHGFRVCVYFDLDLGDTTFGLDMTQHWVIDNNCVKYYPVST